MRHQSNISHFIETQQEVECKLTKALRKHSGSLLIRRFAQVQLLAESLGSR